MVQWAAVCFQVISKHAKQQWIYLTRNIMWFNQCGQSLIKHILELLTLILSCGWKQPPKCVKTHLYTSTPLRSHGIEAKCNSQHEGAGNAWKDIVGFGLFVDLLTIQEGKIEGNNNPSQRLSPPKCCQNLLSIWWWICDAVSALCWNLTMTVNFQLTWLYCKHASFLPSLLKLPAKTDAVRQPNYFCIRKICSSNTLSMLHCTESVVMQAGYK